MIQKILMLCVGNICRSPMAEALLNDRLKKIDSTISVTSAGLAALVDQPADPLAQELLLEKGLDLSSHRARQATREILFNADLILVMESRHYEEIKYIMPSLIGRTHRLGKWDAIDIPDPYQKSRPFFKNALELIEQGIDAWQRKLWN